MIGFEPLRLADTVTQEHIMFSWQGSSDKLEVSIICHTYNHEAYISDAIEGFLSQRTTFPFEILIHDDASTDGTAEIVSRYARRFPAIIRTILREDNQYSQGRRASKFTYPDARGRYIALCEGDDYWIDPYKLTKQVELLEKETDVDLCVHPAHQIDLHTDARSVLGDHGQSVAIKDVADVVGGKKHYAPTASYIMRTRTAVAMPKWFFDDPLPYGDFFIEAITGRRGILFIPDIMSVYRLGVSGSHSARVSNRTAAQMYSDYEHLVAAVDKLRVYSEIPESCIEKKLWRIRNEYARLFLKKRAYKEYSQVSPTRRGQTDYARYFAIRFAALSRPGFAAVYFSAYVLNACRATYASAFKRIK